MKKPRVKGNPYKKFVCPTGATPYACGGGRAPILFIGFIAKHPCLVADRYSCSPMGCHNIMHSIIGVPIKKPASLVMGHV